MVRRYPIVSFFVLAYFFTWTVQIPGIFFAHDRGINVSNEDNFNTFRAALRGDASTDERLALTIFNIGQFGPMIAAFILAGILYGKNGVRDLATRTVKWRVARQWYGIVLALPLLVSGLALIVSFMTGGLSIGPFDPKVNWGLFPAFLLYSMVFNGLAEEPGWRGFALPHVQARRNAYEASWIVGMGWGAWHLPFTVYYNRDEPALIIPATAALLFGIVGWTIVNTWIYNATSSVFLFILLHGWNNTVQSYLVLSQPSYIAQVVFVLVPWGIAFWLTKRQGEEHLSLSPRPTWWPGHGNVERRSLPDSGPDIEEQAQRTASNR